MRSACRSRRAGVDRGEPLPSALPGRLTRQEADRDRSLRPLKAFDEAVDDGLPGKLPEFEGSSTTASPGPWAGGCGPGPSRRAATFAPPSAGMHTATRSSSVISTVRSNDRRSSEALSLTAVTREIDSRLKAARSWRRSARLVKGVCAGHGGVGAGLTRSDHPPNKVLGSSSAPSDSLMPSTAPLDGAGCDRVAQTDGSLKT